MQHKICIYQAHSSVAFMLVVLYSLDKELIQKWSKILHQKSLRYAIKRYKFIQQTFNKLTKTLSTIQEQKSGDQCCLTSRTRSVRWTTWCGPRWGRRCGTTRWGTWSAARSWRLWSWSCGWWGWLRFPSCSVTRFSGRRWLVGTFWRICRAGSVCCCRWSRSCWCCTS